MTKAATKRKPATQVIDTMPAPSRPINAKFNDRIPDIVNSIWGSWIAIKPHIEQATVSAKELADFLDYEISKTELEIKTM